MITAVDTNVLVAYWGPDPALNLTVETALLSALARGGVVISAPVFAELMAGRNRTENFIVGFLEETGIAVDWDLPEGVWRLAGRALRSYAERRRGHRDAATRRLLADFLIGAHAAAHGYRLLTLDERLYRAAFPTLTIDKI